MKVIRGTSKAARPILLLAAALTAATALGQRPPAGLVNFYGQITAVSGNEFQVLTNPGADPQSSYKQEFKTVAFGRATTFESSAPEDLKLSRGVQVVGVEQKDGRVRATKVVVYEANAPVRQLKNVPMKAANGQER